MNKVKKEFRSPVLLQACFYLWVILLLLLPIAYAYDYNGFNLAELKDISLAFGGFYTLALITYIEIKRTKQPKNINFHRFIGITSYVVLVLLLVLFAWSVIDYMNGNLKLKQVYNPVIELFFLYLLARAIKDLKQGLEYKNISLIS